MFQSLKYSNIILRMSLAFVFLWFGIDKMIHPQYWLSLWIPQSLSNFVVGWNINPIDLVYMGSVFEILVGVSLATNIFMRFFSILASIFVVLFLFLSSFSEVAIGDIATMGGLLALAFWPRPRNLF